MSERVISKGPAESIRKDSILALTDIHKAAADHFLRLSDWFRLDAFMPWGRLKLASPPGLSLAGEDHLFARDHGSMEPEPPPSLTHLDERGAARMVDVADRPATARGATAEGFLSMAPDTLALVMEGAAPKGDVLAVARVAAIQGAKRTAELIPLCHPLPLAGVSVTIEAAGDGSGLHLVASARTTAPTGVEMEALTAVQIGLLTLYDMLKAADPAMTIGPVRLVEKHGGRNGLWRHPLEGQSYAAMQ